MAFTLFVTPGFIWLFRRLKWGQFIREDGPQSHKTKHGTPTMGGVVIIVAVVIGYFVGKLANFETPTISALLVLFMLVGLGLVGFIDDFIKTHKQRSLGLTGWAKIALQGVVATVAGQVVVQLVAGAIEIGSAGHHQVFQVGQHSPKNSWCIAISN